MSAVGRDRSCSGHAGDVTSNPSELSLAVQIDHVLVPVDGSELSLGAMPTARVLAERFGADIHTISVVRSDDEPQRLRGERIQALLTALLDDNRGDRAEVVDGDDPAKVIARRAEGLGRTVVCMTTHGRGRFGGAVVGSVTRAVLQRSSVPVIALGPVADNPGWSPRPRSWPEPLSVPRVVACVDGSEVSERVLPAAAAWARSLGMSLTILTVAEDVPPPLRPDPQPGPYGAAVDPARYIEELVEQWRDSVSMVDGAVVHDPIGPADGVRAHLEQRPAGLVALSAHGRSGVQRALLGAEAANIVRVSPAPCLVMPVV